MRIPAELRDPRGFVIAVVTLAANILFRVPLVAALLVAGSVLVAFVLFARLLATPPSAAPAPSVPYGGLSRAEVEVAKLVAEGLTNKEIATRRHVEERTIDTQTQSIRNKLGFNTRAQIAAWVVTNGLLQK